MINPIRRENEDSEHIISVTVGDLYSLCYRDTPRKNTTDLSARTMFGWTGVPIIIVDEQGHRYGFEASWHNEVGKEDYIKLTLKDE